MAEEIQQRDRPELFFALVGAVGTHLEKLSEALRQHLATFAYDTVDIRLSDLLRNYTSWSEPTEPGESGRIRHLQNTGNSFRGKLNNGAALALAGIESIRAERAKRSGNPDQPASGVAYVLHQLKHPAEVELLREVYGSSFVLIAGHAPRETRIRDLTTRLSKGESQPRQFFESKAIEIVRIDEKGDDDFGQNTRDTYPMADFFANLGIGHGQFELTRFVDLLFGHPFRTPSPEEYAMYQASSVSLRSSDDNRQVGAAIVSLTRGSNGKTKNADIVAVGMNEVPRGGGGFYWDQDSPDFRDQALLQMDEDRAKEIKIGALTELIERIAERQWLAQSAATQRASDLARDLLPYLKRTQFMDIGEFSRPVHAEMAALIDAARRGVAVDGRSMYVTTFPCHNCAKHIIAAGIRKVVYLEPYPKSRADQLHGEEIVLESESGDEKEGKVVFSAFTGIAPRQYRQLFSMSERGAVKGNSISKWQKHQRSLVPICVARNASSAYLVAERQELENLPENVYRRERQLTSVTAK